MTIIYANGDSFVAGVELGDDIISGHPGYLPYDENCNQNRWWIDRTYDEKDSLSKERQSKKKQISLLERNRAFPNKIASILNYPMINRAQGGASFDRIARTTIVDLIDLKNQYNNIIALIGTTCPSRSEICNQYASLELDETDFPMTWEQISTTFRPSHQTGTLANLIDFKIQFEKNYHQLINAYKNILLIKQFCEIHKIKLYWISGHANINHIEVEKGFEGAKDLKNLKEYVNFNYSLDMIEIAKKSNLNDVYCPGLHLSESIHDLVAKKIIELL